VTLQLSKVDWRKTLIGLGLIAGIVILVYAALSYRNRHAGKPPAGNRSGLYQPTNTPGDTLPLPQPAGRR